MFTPNNINTVFTVFYWSRAMMLIIYVWNCLLNWNKCIYIYIYSRSRRLYPKQLTIEYTFIQATYNWVFKWTVLNNISFVSVIIVFSLFQQFLDIPTVTSSDVYNVALRYVTIISVCVWVCLPLSPRCSRFLLLITWEGGLAPRWTSHPSKDTLLRKTKKREKGRGLRSVCHWEDAVVLVFLLSVVKLITSEIACYLGNTVLIVVSSV